MSKLIKTDADYSRWIQELKDRYRCAQIKAATRVNQELLRFYWSVGRDIVARDAENKYGSGFYKNLSQDLKDALPDSDGFSRQNLQYMKKMYIFYRQNNTNCPQLVGNFIFLVPWGHHRTIIDTYFEDGNLDAAIFYLKKTVEDGWSRNVLKTFIDSGLHLRQGKA